MVGRLLTDHSNNRGFQAENPWSVHLHARGAQTKCQPILSTWREKNMNSGLCSGQRHESGGNSLERFQDERRLNTADVHLRHGLGKFLGPPHIWRVNL